VTLAGESQGNGVLKMSRAPIRVQILKAFISLLIFIFPAAALPQELLPAQPNSSIYPSQHDPSGQILPDAPSTLHQSSNVGHLDRRGNLVYPNDKPKKILTKPFLGAHAIFLASTVFDVEMTHQGLAHHMCVEQNGTPHPSRGELYQSQLLQFAAVSGVDLLLQAAHLKFAPYMGAIIGTIKHVDGGTRWATGCW
jgi:hypothetical protein